MPMFKNEVSGNNEDAIQGVNSSTGRGVVGVAKTATGVEGNSASGTGVFGTSETGRGVVGVAKAATGVEGNSESGFGVFGGSSRGSGVVGRGFPAGRFDGDVEVTGDIRLVNADCAEDFDIAEADSVDPGTVMVLGEEGVLRESREAYDKRVAGVVSGAGGFRPGIILDKQDTQPNRKPIALLGKVYCKVDASYSPIKVGDLLTTSGTPGHAMKASSPLQAFGAVIGKALRPLSERQGLIPILIALQ